MLSNITGVKDISRDEGSNKNIKKRELLPFPLQPEILNGSGKKNGGRICNSVYGLRRTRDTEFANHELIFKALF